MILSKTSTKLLSKISQRLLSKIISRNLTYLIPVKISALKTEDTGKMFEMAICLSYGIPYDGKYKYDMDLPNSLKPRLNKLTELFPKCVHSAKRGARYDFTACDDPTKHLSAKTIKKGSGKVAPQVIGQAQPQKFCEELGIPYTNVSDLKNYIQTNIKNILPHLVSHTFDCPNLYYHQERGTIMYIEMIKEIDWDAKTFEWTKVGADWNNSSTLKIYSSKSLLGATYIPLVEFQFHSASRTNMAVRWCYDNVLDLFRDNFKITAL
jgi:hypothetical protein